MFASILNRKNYSRVDFGSEAKLRLIIEDQLELDIVELVTTYAINSIPTASCYLSIGRSTKNNTIAKIHEFSNKEEKLLKSKVKLSLNNKKDVILFDGYLVSISPHKSSSQVGIVAHLVHYLNDLNSYNAITPLTHVISPVDLNYLILIPDTPATNTVAKATTMSEIVTKSIQAAKSGDNKFDVWEFIKELFIKLSKTTTILTNFTCIQNEKGDTSSINTITTKSNQTLEDILEKRIENKKFKNFYKGINAKNQIINNWLETTMFVYTNTLTKNNFGISSVWNKLIGEFFPMLFLDLIPTMDRTVVSPVLPTYTPDNLFTVTSNDYYSIETTSLYQRPPKGVIVFAPVNAAITYTNNANAANLIRSGACYINEKFEKDNNSSIIFIKSPPIMNIYNAVLPDVKGILYSYAKQFYVNTFIANRTAALSMPLRFDIGPGTLLRVEGSKEKFIKEDTSFKNIIGLVNKVTIKINANEAVASTGISLTHVREVDNDNYVINDHGIYSLESLPNGDGKNSQFGPYAHWIPLLQI